MIFEHENEYASQWQAVVSIAAKIGCTAETLRKWVRRAEVDSGRREGVRSDERARIKELAVQDVRVYELILMLTGCQRVSMRQRRIRRLGSGRANYQM